MTDPKRWLEDPELPADLGAWLEELPRPQQLPLDKLEALQSQLHSPTTPEWHAGDATTKTPVQPGPSAGLGAQLAGSAAGKLSVTLGLAALGGLGGALLLQNAPDDRPVSRASTVAAPLSLPANPREVSDGPPQGADPRSHGSLEAEKRTFGEASSPPPSTSTPRSASPARAPTHFAPPRSGPPRAAPRRGGIAAEAALLAEAQGALATDPARTLELLRRYDARFPQGELSLERDLLRIDALGRSGQHELAQREARIHLETHPSSPYERRLTSMDALGASNADSGVEPSSATSSAADPDPSDADADSADTNAEPR